MNLYLNGQYLPLEEGRVSVEDRGFQFGDGVYEVIRVYRGKLFRLREHLVRLEQSLRGIEIPLPAPLPKIEEICRKLVGSFREASIYIQVTRGSAPRIHSFPKAIEPTFVAYSREVTRHPDEKTFSLKTLLDDRWGRCHLKTVCLLANILGKEAAVRSGHDEGLFVREDATVTEGTSSNAFLVKGGQVVTHPANQRILSGVTRDVVLGLARELDHRPVERAFTLEEARAADEFFMTGTLTEIMPAVKIDGKPVGRGGAGPVTLGLRAAFRALVARECPEGS